MVWQYSEDFVIQQTLVMIPWHGKKDDVNLDIILFDMEKYLKWFVCYNFITTQ